MPYSDQQINEHIITICDTLKMPDLSSQISWATNTRMKTRGAVAYYQSRHIDFNPDFLAILTPERALEIVAHEVCHISSPIMFSCKPGHNYHWYFHMRCCGYPNAKRCYLPSEAVAMKAHKQTRKVKAIFPNFDTLPAELQAEVLKLAK